MPSPESLPPDLQSTYESMDVIQQALSDLLFAVLIADIQDELAAEAAAGTVSANDGDAVVVSLDVNRR
jgi:hypothetical protein